MQRRPACSGCEAMLDESSETPLEHIIRRMNAAGADFVVIGGQAEYLFGSPRVTYDVDICYRRTPENLTKIVSALQLLNPRLRGAPEGLPFRFDARTIQNGLNFTLETDAGDLDLLGHVEPIGTYDDLIRDAEVYDVGGIAVHTISLAHLIRVKEHIRRDKDRESLRQLLAIRQLREMNARDEGV